MYSRVWGYTSRDLSCTEQCTHQDISDALYQQAQQDEINIHRQKGAGNPSTLFLAQRRDLIGSLAHNAVIEKIQDWNIEIQWTPYYDASIHADQYDLLYDGLRIDVQGTPIRISQEKRIIRPYTSFLIKNEKEQKPMDYYCLTAVDLEERIVHIAGVISYHTLWKPENEARGVPHPAHQVYAKDLTSLRKFIFRT